MATQRCKTEKIDLNPSRVQNPFEHLKRSPGKFDQKVYMEQELNSSNNVKFYRRLYNTQQRAQLNSYDKHIAELKKRSTELRAQNEEYAYLSALRTALHKEKGRRQSGAQTARPVTPEEVRRRLSIERRKTAASMEVEQKNSQMEVEDMKTQQNSGLPNERVNEYPLGESTAGTYLQTGVQEQPQDIEHTVTPTSEHETITKEETKRQKKKSIPRRKCPVSPNRLATLESLSYEIMTNTLPIGKMKRILPEEHLPVHEKWPILSNYRKQTVLPSVKLGKQRLSEDMSSLHTKLNHYFNCENFPLTEYKYVPKEYPTKYRLLKAIETEGIQLPTLPKQ